MQAIMGIMREAYLLFNRMSPYLLFGFFFAGVLHVFIDTKTISGHIGKSNFISVIKAALFGMPLPLCSCSVIPAAMSLRKEGASRGAVLSFLISTPTTGVDSILATYSLLGGFFTIYRIAASLVTGILAGVFANLTIKEAPAGERMEKETCKMCAAEGAHHAHSAAKKIKGIFSYAFGDILKDTALPLLAGIAIGGAIAFFLPQGIVEEYLGSGIKAMFLMLLVGIPMYVCATASIPISAALMLKGMAPGAAFVFLVAGPATNIVTMSVIAKNMGYKALGIYLFSIVFCSISLGLLFDGIYSFFNKYDFTFTAIHRHVFLPDSVALAASVVLFALIVYRLWEDRALAGKQKTI